ncbi:PEP-CTERM sorting domain-containing protein [Nostoc sp. C117]|uniref:PEP-CTERM sorting domain-containing protein n=1 Tax=Nostoc sp. C117 TaxID=3349875 RepID=UPI00370D75D0
MKLCKGLTVASIGAVITACQILGSALPGQAVILSTGIVEAPGVVDVNSGQVGNLDVSTGIFTPFIKGGLPFTDLALNDTGELFAITYNRQLYSINPSSGSSTFIGGGDNTTVYFGLGFDKNNGLYTTDLNGNFYSVNESTGSASLIANTGLSFISDIVFDPRINRFFGLSSIVGGSDSTLFSVDLNGAATPIGNVGSADVLGLAYDNGTLYAYTNDRRQLIINETTGAGVFDKNITGITGEIFGAASSISEAKSVPEPTTLAGTISAIFASSLMKLKRTSKHKHKLSHK